MGTIQNFRDRVKAFNYQAAKIESLEETKDKIPVYNQSQLIKGQRSDGQKISPLYSEVRYALDKERLNPIPGFMVPDLKVTGVFYNSIQSAINTKTISTFSDDEKAPKLEEWYSPIIYGLNAENKTLYAINDVKPVLFQKIRAGIIGG